MANYFAKIAGSVLAANAWNTLANGTGTDHTWSEPETGNTFDLNGLAMTSPTGTTLTCTQIQATTGSLTPTGTLTVNSSVTYNGTVTTGMFVVGNGANLTVNGKVSCTSTGMAIATSGTGILTVAVTPGTTAVEAAASGGGGVVIRAMGTGALSITGNIVVNNTSYTSSVIRIDSDPASHSISGNLTTNALIGNVVMANGGTLAYAGTVSVTGNTGAYGRTNGIWASAGTLNLGAVTLTRTAGGVCLSVGGATVNFTGNYTQGVATDCLIAVTAGTLNLATASAYLAVSNSGRFVVDKAGGTLNMTAAGGTLSITNQSTSAKAAGLNVDLSTYIHEPSTGGISRARLINGS